MKKVLFVLFAALSFPLYISAQLVSASSLIVTKESYPAIELGWKNTIEASYYQGGTDHSYAGVTYELSYRFSESLSVGGKIGLNYAMNCEKSVIAPDTELSPSAINIPFLVDVRYHFPIERIVPFVGLNVGMRISPKQMADFPPTEVEYNASGFVLDPQLGMAYRIDPHKDLYFLAGYCVQSRAKVDTVKGSQISFLNPFYSSIHVGVGLTF